MHGNDSSLTLPPSTPHPHSFSFSTGDQNTDFLKLTYGGKKNFALGKGPTLKESNCRVPQPIMTTSLELLNPLHLYPALKRKCYMILLLRLHLIICYLVLFLCTHLVYTQGDFLGAGPIPWECLNPTTGLCTWMAPVSVGLFDSAVIETDTMGSRLSSFFKHLSADNA